MEVAAPLSFTDATPILCAGVTVHKERGKTEVKPGEWVVIPGTSGLGHSTIQYAKATGMRVAAVGISIAARSARLPRYALQLPLHPGITR